jgi:regulator of replication initiation timing
VRRPYVERRVGPWLGPDLEKMVNLLLRPAPGETPPKPIHEQVYVVPSEVTDSLQELSEVRAQVSDLLTTVEALRAQLDTAREQVTQVREELPERLGDRLSDLESSEPEPPKPPARRTRSSSSRTQKPKSGESS